MSAGERGFRDFSRLPPVTVNRTSAGGPRGTPILTTMSQPRRVLLKSPKHPFHVVALALFAMLFVAGGIAHFVIPQEYVRIVPPQLPWPRALVFVSGVCEVLGGLGLLYRPVRRVAAWELVALLVAVFPANLHMALAGIGAPAWVLWARLPLQVPLIGWAWSYTRKGKPGSNG